MVSTMDTNRMISLSSSNIPSELIDTMAEETGLLWKCVGRFLGLSEDDLHQYKQLSSGKMRVQQMIRDWCGRSGTNVTVQGLLDVCDHVGVEGEVRSVSQRKHGIVFGHETVKTTRADQPETEKWKDKVSVLDLCGHTRHFSPVDSFLEHLESITDYMISYRTNSDTQVHSQAPSGDLTPSKHAMYHCALKRGHVRICHINLHIIGQDRVGKTRFVDALLDLPFNEQSLSTEGAAVQVIIRTSEGWKQVKETRGSMFLQKVTSIAYLDSKDLSVVATESDVAQSNIPQAGTKVSSDDQMLLVDPLRHEVLELKDLTDDQLEQIREMELDKELCGQVKDMVILTTFEHSGQEMFLPTRMSLLPDCSIYSASMYMLVIDLSKPFNGQAESWDRREDGQLIKLDLHCTKTNAQCVQCLLSALKVAHREICAPGTHVGGSEGVDSPLVFAIATHAGEPEAKRLEAETEKEFQKLVAENDYETHVVMADPDNNQMLFKVDNTQSGTDNPDPVVAQIQQRVETMGRRCWDRMDPLPVTWAHLEVAIGHVSKYKKYKIVSLVFILAMAKIVCGIETDEEIVAALKLLHSLGIILYYYRVPGMGNVVFTDPQWLTNVLSTFVTVLDGRRIPSQLKHRVRQLRSEGYMEWPLANFLLKETQAKHDVQQEDLETVLKTLHMFDVIAPALQSPDAPTHSMVKIGSSFFVPSMISTDHTEQCKWQQASTSGRLPPALIFCPHSVDVILEPLFFRLITRCASHFSTPPPQLKRYQSIFHLGHDLELEIVLYEMRYIIASIFSLDESSLLRVRNLSERFSQVRVFLIDQINQAKIHGMDGLKFKICVQPLKENRTVAQSIDRDSLADINNYSPEKPALANKRGGVALRHFPGLNLWFEQCKQPSYSDHVISAVQRHGSARWYEIGHAMGLTDSELNAVAYDKPEMASKLLAVIELKCKHLGKERAADELLEACEKISPPIRGAVEDELLCLHASGRL